MIEFDIKLTETFDCFAGSDWVCELCNIKSLTREGKEENN